MRRYNLTIFSLLAVLVVGIAVLSCGPDFPPDKDATRNRALELPPGFAVKDRIGPDMGDPVDWRRITVTERSDVEVIYELNRSGRTQHTFAGQIELYDEDGNRIQAKTIEPGTNEYPFRFQADPQKGYFFRFAANRGRVRYSVVATVKKEDPCALCLAEERCIDGKCIPPGECHPKCEEGENCVDGECVEACKKGYEWKDGKCVRVRKRCEPACKKGQRCRGGRCVAAAAGGSVSGKILSSWPSGSGTILLINKGSSQTQPSPSR